MKKDLGEWFLGGCILGIIAVMYALMILSNIGCATTQCPPCVPEIETITVKVPTLACPAPEALPTLTYPSWPKAPQIVSEGALKAFYVDVVVVGKAREKILLDRIRVLSEMLDQYRTD